MKTSLSTPPDAPKESFNVAPAPGVRRPFGRSDAPRAALPDLTVQVSIDSHEPISKQIFRALRHAIFTGQMVPGTSLSEKEVSDMFQVSRQPVREAFIKLVEAGVLQVLPQRGTLVKRISRAWCEKGASFARRSKRRWYARPRNSLATSSCKCSSKTCVNRSLLRSQTTRLLFWRLIKHFTTIAQSIDCIAAWDTIQDIKAQMDRVRYLSLPDVSPLDLLIQQHARILSALRAHDSSAAEHAMRMHLREILVSLGPIAARNPNWFETDERERVPLDS